MTRIVCAGMRGSGSTWLYNVVRLAMEQAGRRVRAGMFGDLIGPADADAEVIKAHHFDAELAASADRVFFTHRDLAEAEASQIRRGRIADDPLAREQFRREQQEIADAWSARAYLVFDYESIAADKPAAAACVLAALGVEVDAAALCARVEALPLPASGYDPLTLLWHNHRSGGTSMAFSINDYRWPEDPWPASEPGCPFERIYDEKHRLAQLLRPRSVAEIGVRAGYSAAAFLASGTVTRYTGFDMGDGGGWGGCTGAVAHARQMLPARFPSVQSALLQCDTARARSLPVSGVDLFHVDGDHSFRHALHDLELALATSPRWILIDDCTHHADTVGLAVDAFLGRHRLPHVHLETVRGDVLIQVRQ